jgi:hypothetical protein
MMDLIRFTNFTPSVISSFLFESLKKRMPHRVKDDTNTLSESEIIQFTMKFFRTCEDQDVLLNFWPPFLSYLKEFTSHHSNMRYLTLDVLKLCDLYFELVPFESRKGWKESNDIYVKVFELAIHTSAQIFDRGDKSARSSMEVLNQLPATQQIPNADKFGVDLLVNNNLNLNENQIPREVSFFVY